VNKYRVLLPLTVTPRDVEPGHEGYKQGEEFECEFPVDEERNYLDGGLLEIVPREYKVVGTSVVHGHQPGESFLMALPRGEEELLLGYHLERVDAKSKAKPKADKG